jgi:hypothetical protein
MNTYRSRAMEAGEQTDSETGSCSFCRTACTRVTLSAFGGRCAGCFKAYCNTPQSAPPTGDKNHNPRGWAHALKAREQQGDRLSTVQKRFWREALREFA